VLSVCVTIHIAAHRFQHEHQGERAVDEQVAMAFDVAGVVAVEVDEMGVEGEGGEAEK
jgi:hypothetical protein